MKVQISSFFCVALLVFLSCIMTIGLLVTYKIDLDHIFLPRNAKTKRPTPSTTTTMTSPTTKLPSVEGFTANNDVNGATDQIDPQPIIQKEQDMKDQISQDHVLVNAAKPMKIGNEKKLEMEDEGTIFEEVEEEEEIVVKKKKTPKTTAAPNNN